MVREPMFNVLRKNDNEVQDARCKIQQDASADTDTEIKDDSIKKCQ